MTERSVVMTLVILADCEPCDSARDLVQEIARDNTRLDIRVELVEVLSDADGVIESRAMAHPTLVLEIDGAEQTRLDSPMSQRRVLRQLLPYLYPDERTALTQLRRQLDSPTENFPKGRLRGRVRQSDKIELLRDVPLFADLNRRQLGHLARIADELHPDEGHTLITQGEPGDEFFVVAEGAVRIVKNGRAVATLGPGECFGEMSLLDDLPRSATVVTSTPSTIVAIHRGDFDRLLNAVPAITRAMLTTLSHRLR